MHSESTGLNLRHPIASAACRRANVRLDLSMPRAPSGRYDACRHERLVRHNAGGTSLPVNAVYHIAGFCQLEIFISSNRRRAVPAEILICGTSSGSNDRRIAPRQVGNGSAHSPTWTARFSYLARPISYLLRLSLLLGGCPATRPSGERICRVGPRTGYSDGGCRHRTHPCCNPLSHYWLGCSLSCAIGRPFRLGLLQTAPDGSEQQTFGAPSNRPTTHPAMGFVSNFQGTGRETKNLSWFRSGAARRRRAFHWNAMAREITRSRSRTPPRSTSSEPAREPRVRCALLCRWNTAF